MTELEMLDDMRRKERQAERRAITMIVKKLIRTESQAYWAEDSLKGAYLQACEDIVKALATRGKA